MIKESIKKKYTCPHCFTKFTKQQALFRCQSIPEICDYEDDAIYTHHHPTAGVKQQGRLIESQSQDFLKKFNESEGQKCDLCAHNTEQRVCPTCHHNLDKDFFQTQHIHVGVIGAMTSQLSHFVTMAKQSFSENLAHNLGLMIHPSSDKSLEIRFERLEKSKSPLNKIAATADYYSFVFHGVGEDESKIERNKYDAFLYFLPIPTLPLKFNAFENLMKLVHNSTPSQKNKLSKPFAIMYHSFEKLAALLPDSNILLRQTDYVGGYNTKDSDQISGEMMAYTGAWYGANTLHFIKRHLPNHQFFAFSLTYPNDQIASNASGWKVADSLVWLLRQNKIVKDKNQKDQLRAGMAQIRGARKIASKV